MAEDTKPSSAASPEQGSPPSGGRSASDLREIADSLRSRVDLFGKTLAAVVSLGTAAVGLDRIGDLFPMAGNEEWALAACLGLALASLAAIWVAVRLMLVARPVFLSPDLELGGELSGDEREVLRPVYESAARRFGYTSLAALQERERSLRNAASRTTDKDERARRTALADEVKTEIEQALARGQVVAVRRRATKAVTGWSWALYVSVVVGLIAFALGTDKVSSERTDVAAAKACGEARDGGATAEELGNTGVCEDTAKRGAAAPKQPSAAAARAQIVEKLAAALTACTALVHKAGDAESGPLANATCDPVRDAAVALLSPANR
jgi:hypothetical protein